MFEPSSGADIVSWPATSPRAAGFWRARTRNAGGIPSCSRTRKWTRSFAREATALPAFWPTWTSRDPGASPHPSGGSDLTAFFGFVAAQASLHLFLQSMVVSLAEGERPRLGDGPPGRGSGEPRLRSGRRPLRRLRRGPAGRRLPLAPRLPRRHAGGDFGRRGGPLLGGRGRAGLSPGSNVDPAGALGYPRSTTSHAHWLDFDRRPWRRRLLGSYFGVASGSLRGSPLSGGQGLSSGPSSGDPDPAARSARPPGRGPRRPRVRRARGGLRRRMGSVKGRGSSRRGSGPGGSKNPTRNTSSIRR